MRALDDQSAFIASLGANRSARMREASSAPSRRTRMPFIRAGSRGALVVDGGPGTGKTVVALHRTAYLLYFGLPPRAPEGWRAVRRSPPALPGLRRRRAAQPRRGGRADLHPARPRPRGPLCPRPREQTPPPRFSSRPWEHGGGRRAGDQGSTRSRRPRGMQVETPYARPVAPASTTGPRRSEHLAPGTPHNEARDGPWDELSLDPGGQARRWTRCPDRDSSAGR